MYIVTSKWYVVSDQFDLHTIWWVKGNFCGCDDKKAFHRYNFEAAQTLLVWWKFHLLAAL